MSRAPTGHRLLVVEDDPVVRETLEGLFASRGDSVRFAPTVEEALAALAEERFCCVIVDQQLPARAGGTAFLSGGECVMTAHRKRDDRRNEDGRHVTPMIVVTAYAHDEDFIAKMFELGADAFVKKPLTPPQIEKLLDKVRMALEKAKRHDHDACAALSPAAIAAPPGPPPVVHVVLDAVRSMRRIGFLVDGWRRELQDARFAVFLRLAGARERGSPWAHRDALRVTRSPETPSRIGDAFEGLVPEGFVVVERDGEGNFRLNPAIAVAPIDWAALCEHPSAEVRAIASEQRAITARRSAIATA